MTWDEKMFFKVMEAFAQQSQIQINEFTLEAYEEALKQYGIVKFVEAAKKIMFNGSRKIPTITEFKQAMGVPSDETLTYDEQAKIIVKKIEHAIRNMGYTNEKKAETYIGPIGWKAILLSGSWSSLCEVLEENISYKMNSFVPVITAILKNPNAVDNINKLGTSQNIGLPEGVKALLEPGMRLE